jgi:hypothetical protein
MVFVVKFSILMNIHLETRDKKGEESIYMPYSLFYTRHPVSFHQ